MDNLLRELKKVDYTAQIIAQRREEQRKEWLNSRMSDCGQQNNFKKRRFNPNVHDVTDASVDARSEQEAIAKKPEHLPSVVSVQSDTQSNT